MDRALLRKLGNALTDVEMGLGRMMGMVNLNDPEMDELVEEISQLEGAVVEFDRYLHSFSLPALDK